MPTEGQIIEAMGRRSVESPTNSVIAHATHHQAVMTLRLAIAAERIADAMEAIAARPGGMG